MITQKKLNQIKIIHHLKIKTIHKVFFQQKSSTFFHNNPQNNQLFIIKSNSIFRESFLKKLGTLLYKLLVTSILPFSCTLSTFSSFLSSFISTLSPVFWILSNRTMPGLPFTYWLFFSYIFLSELFSFRDTRSLSAFPLK